MASPVKALKNVLPNTTRLRLGLISAIGDANVAYDSIQSKCEQLIAEIRRPLQQNGGLLPLDVECCIQTQTEARLAIWAYTNQLNPELILPLHADDLLASIGDDRLRNDIGLTIRNNDRLTILDETTVSISEDTAMPSLGQRLVTCHSDILFIVVSDFDHGLDWLRSIAHEVPFNDGLVVAAAPGDAAPRLVGLVEGELDTQQFEEFLVNLQRRRMEQSPANPPDFTRGPRFSFGGVFITLLALISKSKPKSWHFRFPKCAALAPSQLGWPAVPFANVEPDEARQLGCLREHLSMPFTWADLWAIHNGNLLRTICVLLLLLNVVAVSTALLGYLDQVRCDVWHFLEVASIVTTLGAYLWSRWARIHEKWVTYRLFAELLRPAQYFWAAAAEYHPSEPRVRNPELRWWRSTVVQYRSVIRGIGPPRLRLTRKYVYMVKAMLQEFIAGQIDWHLSFRSSHSVYQERLVKTGRLMFWLVLFMALAHWIAIMWPEWIGILESEDILEPLFLAAACILAVVGFAIGILVHQLDFEQIASRSELAAARFQPLLARMKDHRNEVTREILGGWLTECGEIIVDEQHSWFQQISKVSIHL